MLKVKPLRVDKVFEGADYLVYFFSASPFFGLSFLFDKFVFDPAGISLSTRQVFLAINIFLAALMTYLAFRQRRRIKRAIFVLK